MEYLTEWMLMARSPNTLTTMTQLVEGLSDLEYPTKLILLHQLAFRWALTAHSLEVSLYIG